MNAFTLFNMGTWRIYLTVYWIMFSAGYNVLRDSGIARTNITECCANNNKCKGKCIQDFKSTKKWMTFPLDQAVSALNIGFYHGAVIWTVYCLIYTITHRFMLVVGDNYGISNSTLVIQIILQFHGKFVPLATITRCPSISPTFWWYIYSIHSQTINSLQVQYNMLQRLPASNYWSY